MNIERLTTAKYHEDIEAVKALYPFIVYRYTRDAFSPEVGEWLLPYGERHVVIGKEVVYSGPEIGRYAQFKIAHAFKNEADAVAFKLRFG